MSFFQRYRAINNLRCMNEGGYERGCACKNNCPTPVVTTPVVTTPVVTTPVGTTPVGTTPVGTTPVVTTPALGPEQVYVVFFDTSEYGIDIYTKGLNTYVDTVMNAGIPFPQSDPLRQTLFAPIVGAATDKLELFSTSDFSKTSLGNLPDNTYLTPVFQSGQMFSASVGALQSMVYTESTSTIIPFENPTSGFGFNRYDVGGGFLFISTVTGNEVFRYVAADLNLNQTPFVIQTFNQPGHVQYFNNKIYVYDDIFNVSVHDATTGLLISVIYNTTATAADMLISKDGNYLFFLIESTSTIVKLTLQNNSINTLDLMSQAPPNVWRFALDDTYVYAVRTDLTGNSSILAIRISDLTVETEVGTGKVFTGITGT